MEKGRIRIEAKRRTEIGLIQLAQALLATLDDERDSATGRPQPVADPSPSPTKPEEAA